MQAELVDDHEFLTHRVQCGVGERRGEGKIALLERVTAAAEESQLSQNTVRTKAAGWLGIARLTLREKLLQLGLQPRVEQEDQ